MVNYKELGLVNTRDMFARAIKGGYAIPAFNFNNMEQMQAIIKAAVETKSPVILQVSGIYCTDFLSMHCSFCSGDVWGSEPIYTGLFYRRFFIQ